MYGKTTVIKTLALPKVLYVTSLLDTPRDFVKKVKSLVLDFLWSRRKPKVKYSAIIGNKLRGGLEFPDIQSKIEAQHIMCIKRIIDDNQNKLRPFKEIPLNYLKPLGGAYGISNNFNVKMVPKKIPPFYKTCFWAKVFKMEPNSTQNIISQPVLNNIYIPIKQNAKFISFLIEHKIINVYNILAQNGKPKTLAQITPDTSQYYKQHFLSWTSLISSIPKTWIKQVAPNSRGNSIPTEIPQSIVFNNTQTVLKSITAKQVYSKLVSNIMEDPTAKQKFVIKYDNEFWKKACENIQKTSIDSYSRHFQFKILHQYLGVNSNLFKWKILDSPRVSYCATDIETIKHLFCDCHVTRCLYYKIKEWCQSLNINLPEINEKSVLYGIQTMCEDSQIINTLILTYKQLVFKCKDIPSNLTLARYKFNLKQLEKIESSISAKLGKCSSHLINGKGLMQ